MKIILLATVLFVPLAGISSALAVHNAHSPSQGDRVSRPITVADGGPLSDRTDADADAREGYALDRLSIPSGPFSVADFGG